MKPDHRNALLVALEKGIAEPGNKGSWRFYNASAIPELSDEWKDALLCEQGFRPEFLKLQQQGYSVTHTLANESGEPSGAIFFLGRSRRWNEFRISEIWNSLKPGQRLIVAANKTDGIGAIRKWFSQHAEISDSLSKHHAVVFWADKRNDVDLPTLKISKSVGEYTISEGMFSADGPDAGSRLLVEQFDARIKGEVADLGAAWGYLSAELAKETDRITAIELFEADYLSLEAAKTNLANTTMETTFHWIDVTTEFPKKPYEWVIMNPPFHAGRAAEPGIGQRFIEVAASTLPRGGRLLMVANKNLPYERTLENHFRSFEKLAEQDGFKVIEAVR
ncbi:MAG: class I SAM-dependent methyltransferase [Pseudomonadota bacterium]